MRRAALLVLVPALLGVLAPGCQRRSPPAPAPAPDTPPGLALPKQEPVRPVYPTTLEGAPDPLAQQLCAALHQQPEQRRAQCCPGRTPGSFSLAGECVRTLTTSVGSGAIKLVAAEVAACEKAMAQALGGCEWVGPWPVPLPAACRGLLHGTVPGGGACRSSLECGEGRRCQGAGPTQMGQCGPPRPAGQACSLAVDPLGAFTQQEDLDRDHPECAGFCDRLHRCEAPLPVGAPCVTSGQCHPGRCAAGKCVAAAVAQLGEACTGGDCAEGLRCHGGACIRPGAAGAACQSDFECLGGCNEGAGGKTCGPKCSAR